MPLSPSSMASYVYGKVYGSTDASEALSKMYQGICEYCEANMIIQYTWSSLTPPYPFIPSSVPDPQVLLTCKVLTTPGILSPSGATTPEAALSKLASDLNSLISGWQVSWPAGFTLPPAFILPAIVLTPSNATTPESAWQHICSEIIAGITVAATPGPLPGAHLIYSIPTPGASFSKIL